MKVKGPKYELHGSYVRLEFLLAGIHGIYFVLQFDKMSDKYL
jgi:hypothetical protein